MPRSVSLVGLARKGVIPQNNSTPECSFCDPVVLGDFVQVAFADFIPQRALAWQVCQPLPTLDNLRAHPCEGQVSCDPPCDSQIDVVRTVDITLVMLAQAQQICGRRWSADTECAGVRQDNEAAFLVLAVQRVPGPSKPTNTGMAFVLVQHKGAEA